MGDRSKITIRTMRPEDFALLEQLQRDCYPTLDSKELMRVEHFESQYKVFPEGQFVAVDDDPGDSGDRGDRGNRTGGTGSSGRDRGSSPTSI